MAWYSCRLGGGAGDSDTLGILIGSGSSQKQKDFILTEDKLEEYGIDFDELTAENFYIHANGMTTLYVDINDWDKNTWPDDSHMPWDGPKISYNPKNRTVTVSSMSQYCSFVGKNDQNGTEAEQIFRAAISYQLYLIPFMKRPKS